MGPVADLKASTQDESKIERVLSTTDDDALEKDHADYNRMDKEIAKYADAVAIEISPAEDKRLRKLIDRRVLVCMILTYFLQALDKGTVCRRLGCVVAYLCALCVTSQADSGM